AELERRGPAVPERAADFARHGEPAGHGTVGHQPNDAAAAAQPSRPAYRSPGISDLHPQAPSSRPERTPASASRSFDASVSPPVNVAAVPRPPLPGVVRHTETVHVTTRHTIVDQPGDVPGPGMGHGRVYGAQDAGGHWAPEPSIPAATGPGPDSWAPEPRPQRRDGIDDGRLPYDRPGPEPDEEAGWSDLRAGDRWASVRADEQGRELRMGERRAAVRADGSGTEFRIEDRWAAVRQEEPGWNGTGGEPGAGGRALPAGEPSGSWQQPSGSWGQRWDEPAREPVRRGNRRRSDEEYGLSPEDRASGGGRAPRVDFDPSDDRWR
ncbi:MAG TPA: hypothetical protein VFX61_03460, partial [Micromonosporaceae bacterium]|nr:hypothetical protein [Micromonosporaceae bacterium]